MFLFHLLQFRLGSTKKSLTLLYLIFSATQPDGKFKCPLTLLSI
jgi:hypothetical protein